MASVEKQLYATATSTGSGCGSGFRPGPAPNGDFDAVLDCLSSLSQSSWLQA